MNDDLHIDDIHEQVLSTVRFGDKVLAIMFIEGRKIIGIGDDVYPAIVDCFKAAYPGHDVEGTIPMLMALPRKEDLPEVRDPDMRL